MRAAFGRRAVLPPAGQISSVAQQLSTSSSPSPFASASKVFFSRLSREIKDMEKEGVRFVIADNEKEQMKTGAVIYSWVVGPRDTPYAGYAYEIRIYLPDEWPVKSPSVAFTTRVLHVNIEIDSGAICCNQLNEDYVPTLRLSTMINIILPQLLEHPNASDPFNASAASQSMSNPDRYNASILQHAVQYAIPMHTLHHVVNTRQCELGTKSTA